MMETTLTYRGHVRNGQIALDEPVRLPEGAEVSVRLMNGGQEDARAGWRRQILRLPMEQRRELLKRQSETAAGVYEPDAERAEWQGGDFLK